MFHRSIILFSALCRFPLRLIGIVIFFLSLRNEVEITLLYTFLRANIKKVVIFPVWSVTRLQASGKGQAQSTFLSLLWHTIPLGPLFIMHSSHALWQLVHFDMHITRINYNIFMTADIPGKKESRGAVYKKRPSSNRRWSLDGRFSTCFDGNTRLL